MAFYSFAPAACGANIPYAAVRIIKRLNLDIFEVKPYRGDKI